MNNVKSRTIYRIFADKSGDIWVATDGGGVSIFNGFLFSHYDFSNISNNFVMKVHIDDMGNKWLGTDGDGVIFMNESRRFLRTDKDEFLLAKSSNDWVRANIIQGTLESQSLTSTGESMQSFNIQTKGTTDHNLVKVSVNGEQ